MTYEKILLDYIHFNNDNIRFSGGQILNIEEEHSEDKGYVGLISFDGKLVRSDYEQTGFDNINHKDECYRKILYFLLSYGIIKIKEFKEEIKVND